METQVFINIETKTLYDQRVITLKGLPVMIQTKTTIIDMVKLKSSAEVNLPQKPNEILVLLPHGL